jgi:hypothetical protein
LANTFCNDIEDKGVIARPRWAKQSHKKRLRLPRRYASRNDIFYYEIAQPVSSKAKESHKLKRNSEYNWGQAPIFVPFFRQLFSIYDNKATRILWFCLKILGMKVAKDV